MSTNLKKVAERRLKRDLVELEQANICSIAARPLDNNLFEWHVNIKPTDGVYCGVYFHLIMVFPGNYPTNPPTVKICTPIRHPNIFNEYLCLSILRSHTSNVPYEGWSGAYTVTSILMQLQSFLFAEKIDQDEGYQANAQLSDNDVNQSLSICKSLHCQTCSHSHNTPWPKVRGPPEAMIKVFPTDPHSGHVTVMGSAAQTTHTYWVGAYGEFGCNYGKVMYEAFINWTGDKWSTINIRGGLCRFGFGSQYAMVCGRDEASFGYGGTGMFSFANEFNKFGASFTKDDTITVAVDFDEQRIYFAKNGVLQEPNRALWIPQALQGVLLFPILSFKNSRAEFNFGAPKKPCQWLLDRGFQTLEAMAIAQGNMQGEADDPSAVCDGDDDDEKQMQLDWHSAYVIDELWQSIFLSLSVQGIFACKYVCQKWHHLIVTFNLMERNETCCYFSKVRLSCAYAKISASIGQPLPPILGIGLKISEGDFGNMSVTSQMDILSHAAWMSGVRTGVWGESLTHFLPLVMNHKHAEIAAYIDLSPFARVATSGAELSTSLVMNHKHAEIARTSIYRHLQGLRQVVQSYRRRPNNSFPSELDKVMAKNECLQLVDTLVTMMNLIVVQFVTSNSANANNNNVNANHNNHHNMYRQEAPKVSMMMCEKVVLGYCALHHLLLYLQSEHKTIVTNYANQTIDTFLSRCSKQTCPDLGKLLIYLMLSSKYEWCHIATHFVVEVFARNVRWMVKERKYARYDTTAMVADRLPKTFEATTTSRRLCMFQVYFSRNAALESLQGYNQRLGRPSQKIRNGIQQKTKFILSSRTWWDYFNELQIVIKDNRAIDQLLRSAVYTSKAKGYHHAGHMAAVNAPPIRVNGDRIVPVNNVQVTDDAKCGIKRGSGRGWGLPPGARGAAWRGRGRGRGRGGVGSVSMGRGEAVSQYSNPHQPQQSHQPQRPKQVQQPGATDVDMPQRKRRNRRRNQNNGTNAQ
eukprot:CAMPEP_0202726024 /NCGR_PEP_ID=MMETSP1385-20130828/184398_1 /ASSEMBLY_ACC=CAM_ASM_000861 /TAXON_ID=933848 /ORGANISM="Elphidium margaritaceum" /LENGTH=973 /DNA_ID=CAMNT_0049392237 /DNA_START=99 /DNA_END=3019 /DNA_ORIENTATION=+